MVDFYVRRILNEKMTLEEVPSKWYNEVVDILQELEPIPEPTNDYATAGRILLGVE